MYYKVIRVKYTEFQHAGIKLQVWNTLTTPSMVLQVDIPLDFVVVLYVEGVIILIEEISQRATWIWQPGDYFLTKRGVINRILRRG